MFPQISRIEKIHLVLLFEEVEISQNGQHIDEIKEKLNLLKELGYNIALSMMDKSLLLDHNFYNMFDYFVDRARKSGVILDPSFSLIWDSPMAQR